MSYSQINIVSLIMGVCPDDTLAYLRCFILRIQRQRADSVDLDEVAHYELPYLDLQVQIQQFWALKC